MQMTQQDVERFWSKVDKSAGPDSCWVWIGAMTDGYGDFWCRPRVQTHRAHRIAYMLAYGDIDSSIMVCHRCDNPPCVNPAHLWIGSALDNTRDCYAKQRNVNLRGSGHGNALLTEDDVAVILLDWMNGASQKSLATRFGVDKTSISLICRRKGWRHVPAPWELPSIEDARL